MSAEAGERPNVYTVPPGSTLEEVKAMISDAGRRRHLSWGMDFDTRALTLGEQVEDHWEPERKEMHRRNQEKHRRVMAAEYGEHALEAKIENFVAMDTKPMSVLAYHNDFFEQVRRSFVMGDYFPALVGVSALGERILNHLILDMRPYFTGTPEYRHVYRKSSFDNWEVPIATLEAWEILLPRAAKEFRALKALRHRSIHFNVSTYSTLREDALAGILHMRAIIEEQFGSFARRPWFIPGSTGHVFIKKEYESHPFVRTYFLPRCPFVGPLFGMSHGADGWEFHDLPDYGDGAWTDEEFVREYQQRDPQKVMLGPPDLKGSGGHPEEASVPEGCP